MQILLTAELKIPGRIEECYDAETSSLRYCDPLKQIVDDVLESCSPSNTALTRAFQSRICYRPMEVIRKVCLYVRSSVIDSSLILMKPNTVG